MRPYIQGLDETEFSNLMRNWFKHGQIEASILAKLGKQDWRELEHSFPEPWKIISLVEEVIRDELYGYAKELEDSKTKLEAFLDGVDFALRPTKDEDV
jgi:hypothetical protein